MFLNDRPAFALPEIAVVGRSNVGKSSLINTVFQRRHLAKISSTPGKTRLMNYFSVDNIFYLVDLPGYGYAKVSKSEQKKWKEMIENFFTCNQSLILTLLLIDSRHNIMENDRLMISWLDTFQIPFVIIMTKKDKLSNNKFNIQYKNIHTIYSGIEIIPFSAKSAQGRDEIINVIKRTVD